MAITIETLEAGIANLRKQRNEYLNAAIRCDGAIETLQQQLAELKAEAKKKK